MTALNLPCQIYALYSGTDARHAASAQEKTMAKHNNYAQVTGLDMCVNLDLEACPYIL